MLSAPMLQRIAIAASLIVLAGGEATAQDRPWWGQRGAQAQNNATVRGPTDAVERDAAQLYAEARSDLDAERLASAQRKLEGLVWRYPTSALADVARRDLARLYGASSPQLGQPGTPMPQPRRDSIAPVAIQSEAPSRALGIDASSQPPAASILLTSGVRLANEDFRQQAGDRVFFADGSTELGQRARLALEAQATWLIRHPESRILIEGHADDQGSRDINRQLSEKRADVVRLRLNDLGIADSRMRVLAHGRNEPIADCADSSCKLQNRRVVTMIVHVPPSLGFDEPGRRTLGAAAGAVGQPSARAP